jgi:(S)-2-hydroxyglutarate dehydrogenase
VAHSADVAIIGAGLVGLATAHHLATQHGLRVVVVDKEPRVAAHQSSHNSGVIHSGLYYAPGSYRARLCVRGREQMVAFCRQHGVAHDVCGKLVVATRDDELARLDGLLARGRENGLAVRAVDAHEIQAIEPHARGVRALFVPEAGIADYPAVAAVLARRIAAAGGEVALGTPLRHAREQGLEVLVQTSSESWRVRALVACAGLQADRVAAACGVATDIVIAPFRGEYYQLAPARASLVRNLIYPVPDPRFPFLGVHFTRMATGGVEAGPNAVMALAREGYSWGDVSLGDMSEVLTRPGVRRFVTTHVGTGIAEIRRSLSKALFTATLARLVPTLTQADLVPGGSGVRAMALTPAGTMVDDFKFVETGRMVHVLNAPSPAATASLAIGEEVAARVIARLA